jgi:hypothetical protein
MRQKKSLLINKLLSRLLNLVFLEDARAEVLLAESTSAKLEYQPVLPYLVSDPRINFLKHLLEKIFSHINLLSDKNTPILPFAFRLKYLKNWIVKTDASNFLSQMSWRCQTSCIFCCQKGNPPEARIKKRISEEEIHTRLKYFDGENGYGLVGGEFLENDEVLNNPRITEILRTIRQKGYKKMIEITTGGTALTGEMIKEMVRSSPIFLIISLNSANPGTRKWLMNDPDPAIAICSLPLLKKHKIPFVVSIVTWPGLPFSDIEETISYAAKNDAYYVRLLLPGHSKFFSKRKLFSIQTHWAKAVKHFYPLSLKSPIPILVVPDMFAQYLFHEQVDAPIIIGAIKNSPAFKGGINAGDIIKEIDGKEIYSVENAYAELKNKNRVLLNIARAKSIINIELEYEKNGRYPYCYEELKDLNPFGVLLPKRFMAHEDIKDIGRYIDLYGAKRVAILASTRARPIIKYLLRKYHISSQKGINVQVAVPKNSFFGGNIDSADLLVSRDYIRAIQSLKFNPDLVLMPSSPFTRWGRDLIGELNLEIERKTGVPVEFIYNRNEA